MKSKVVTNKKLSRRDMLKMMGVSTGAVALRSEEHTSELQSR